ncbi:MAG: hypothetical protein Q7P63_10530 [Verrucomicrobiota bacterium JB022]|nr:hypothetical protein [Verrucomicrobiota bacterium JB022]
MRSPDVSLPSFRCVRVFLALLAVLCLAGTAFGQKIELLGETFDFRASSTSSTADLNEYTPAGQNLRDWQSYVGVRTVYNVQQGSDYASALAARYQEQYPDMPFGHGYDEKADRYWLDYLAFPLTEVPEDQRYLVWNFLLVEPNGNEGIIVLQYARRVRYTEAIAEGIEKMQVTEKREQWVKQLTARPIAEVLAGPKE